MITLFSSSRFVAMLVGFCLLSCVRSTKDSTVFTPGAKLPSLEHTTMTCQFGELRTPRPLCLPNEQKSCIRQRLPDQITGIDTGKDPLLNPKSPPLPVVRSKQAGLSCRPPKDITSDLWAELTGHFLGVNQIKIAYKIIRKPLSPSNLPMVVILTGYNESYLNYMETAEDFLQKGYEVAMMDHRGMGLSDRLTSNPNMGHIDDFSYYVQDATFFVQNIVKKAPENTFLLAHSTGGLIGAHMMAQYPKLFARAVMISPLMELRTGSIPAFVSCGLVNLCQALGRDQEYVAGCSVEKERQGTFQSNQLTHNEVRFRIKKDIRKDNPQSELGPPSNRWLKLIFDELKPEKISKIAQSIRTPILLLQAENDTVVGAKGQELFCKNANQCDLKTIKNSFHSIHLENNDIRSEFLRLSFDFFQKNVHGSL
jgi:lysophospholipase